MVTPEEWKFFSLFLKAGRDLLPLYVHLILIKISLILIKIILNILIKITRRALGVIQAARDVKPGEIYFLYY